MRREPPVASARPWGRAPGSGSGAPSPGSRWQLLPGWPEAPALHSSLGVTFKQLFLNQSSSHFGGRTVTCASRDVAMSHAIGARPGRYSRMRSVSPAPAVSVPGTTPRLLGSPLQSWQVANTTPWPQSQVPLMAHDKAKNPSWRGEAKFFYYRPFTPPAQGATLARQRTACWKDPSVPPRPFHKQAF